MANLRSERKSILVNTDRQIKQELKTVINVNKTNWLVSIIILVMRICSFFGVLYLNLFRSRFVLAIAFIWIAKTDTGERLVGLYFYRSVIWTLDSFQTHRIRILNGPQSIICLLFRTNEIEKITLFIGERLQSSTGIYNKNLLYRYVFRVKQNFEKSEKKFWKF